MIKENNLNRDEILILSIWEKHNGLIILAIVVGLYFLYLKLSPKEKEYVIEYVNEETPNTNSKKETKEEEKTKKTK